MAENEGGESKFMTGFLLGFLVGVLICLGAGGTFFMVRAHRTQVMVKHDLLAAEEARREVEQAHAEAVKYREMAEKANREAKKK